MNENKLKFFTALSVMLIGLCIMLIGIFKTESWMSVAGLWEVLAGSFLIELYNKEKENE